MKIAAMVVVGALVCAAADDLPPIPPTPKKPVTDEYQGVKVVDDYRWLEPASSPEVREWSKLENARTRAYLDHLPMRPAIAEALERLLASQSTRFSSLNFRGGTLFAIETQPPKPQPFLVTLASADDPGSARAIVDPNAIDPSGRDLDRFLCSFARRQAGRGIAFEGRKRRGVGFGIRSRHRKAASGCDSARQRRDGRRERGLEREFERVLVHALSAGGRTRRSGLEFLSAGVLSPAGRRRRTNTRWGKEFPRIAEVALDSSDDGKYVLARVANGDGGDFLHYLLGPDGNWHQITRLSDQTSAAAFGPGGSLFLLSHKDAPMGKICRADASRVFAREREDGGDAGPLLDRGVSAGGGAPVCALHGGRAVEAARQARRASRSGRWIFRRFRRWARWSAARAISFCLKTRALRNRRHGIATIRPRAK